jgi:hypothetical protein
MRFRVFWDVALHSYVAVDRNFRGAFALMMEAVRTSETSVNFNVTIWRYILEDSKLNTRCCEKLKSHKLV